MKSEWRVTKVINAYGTDWYQAYRLRNVKRSDTEQNRLYDPVSYKSQAGAEKRAEQLNAEDE